MSAAVWRPIVRCAIAMQPASMNASPPLTLSADDKLDALRYLDEFRFWHSLDDRRRCRRCHQEITGHRILLYEDKGARGGRRLRCPTPGCGSTPSEWFYDDPVLAATLKSDSRPRLNFTQERIPPQAVTGRPSQSQRKRGRKTREALAQMPMLRSIATGLHAIRPVA